MTPQIIPNWRKAWRMASNWVMVISGMCFSAFLSLTPAQQQAVYDALPIAPWAVPLVAAIVGVAARLVSQPKVQA